MCLLFFYINSKPNCNEYKIILVNNRDELYSRPTENAHIWPTDPKIIAGEDAEPDRKGGTWLGVSETGKIGCLLNILQPKETFISDQLAGRGFLTVDFLLKKDISGLDYIRSIEESKIAYSKFHLLLFERRSGSYEAIHYSNVDQVKRIEPGVVHGFGNSYLSKPFNKVCKGKKELQKVLDEFGTKDKECHLVDALFSMMRSKERLDPDEVIRQQGKGYEDAVIQGYSSIWVTIPEANYGTRTTTVILIDANDHLSYYERTMKTPSPFCTDIEASNFNWELI